MQSKDFLTGYLNSGAWRFGGKAPGAASGEYKPESFNGELMTSVGNPFKKGLIDEALAKTPVTTAATTGLLADQSRSSDKSGGKYGNGTNYSDGDWADIKDMRDAYGGFNNPFDKTGVKLASGFVGNPVATLMSLKDVLMGNKIDPQTQILRDFQTFKTSQGDGYALGRAAQDSLASFGIPTSSSISTMSKQDSDALDKQISEWAAMSGESSGGVSFSGNESNYSGGYDGGATYGYAKGGMVNGLIGPNPKGEDDGFAALQRGEYVVKKSAVKKYGKGLLDDINQMKFKGEK